MSEKQVSSDLRSLVHPCAQVLAQSCGRAYPAVGCECPTRFLWCRSLKAAAQYAAVCGVVLLTCGTAASARKADRSPPTAPRIAGPRVTSSPKPVYQFSARDRQTRRSRLRYRCSFDSRRLHACHARFSQRLVRGRHELRAQAVDRAGNRSAVRSITVKVENQGGTPPGPPPPPPPPSGCTKTLAAGRDLSSFLSTLANGDVGCLRAGEYRDGCAVSWATDAASRIVLKSYPGEQAILHTSLGLAGTNLTASHLRVTGIDAGCGSRSGFTVQGANDVIEYSSVYDVPGHGIVTNTSSSNVTIHGNFIESVGSECNLDHGIYFQTSGRISRNVFKDSRCGYGIHLYAHTHDTIVAENTSVGSRVRAGIIIRTDGSNIAVVNNIFVGNATYGIYYVACGSGCVVDRNIHLGQRPRRGRRRLGRAGDGKSRR